MKPIHDNIVNNIAECNLLHGKLNHYKRTKDINSYYYPILHGCMNTRRGKAKLYNFLILLDSEYSSTIEIIRLIIKLKN